VQAAYREQWLAEIAAAERTLELIRACVAPSPRRAAWVWRTEVAIRLLKRHYARANKG
jgi:hypothetical protein